MGTRCLCKAELRVRITHPRPTNWIYSCMKVRTLKNNAVEAYDFDIYSDEHIADLGRLVANESVVLVDQKLDQKRTYEIQMQWGTPTHSIVEMATSHGTMKEDTGIVFV